MGRYREAVDDFAIVEQSQPTMKVFGAIFYAERAPAYYYLKEYDKAWDDIDKGRSMGATVSADFLDKLKAESGRNDYNPGKKIDEKPKNPATVIVGFYVSAINDEKIRIQYNKLKTSDPQAAQELLQDYAFKYIRDPIGPTDMLRFKINPETEYCIAEVTSAGYKKLEAQKDSFVSFGSLSEWHEI